MLQSHFANRTTSFPIDFSRAELKWAIDLIEKVGKEGHMDALASLTA